MALSNTILATPSTLVVPLSAIIDRLQGKLSAADLNALLLSVTGTVKSQVQPGDLITAELMNEVLAAIGDLQIRVGQLENVSVTPSDVRIDGFRNAGPVHVTDPIEMIGVGFLVPALLNTVTMAGVPVDNLRGGAAQLFFQVPRLSLPAGGSAVTVKLVNANGTATSTPIVVLPQSIVPSGQTQVTYATPPVMPAGQPNLAANGSYTFLFTLRFVPAVDNTSPNASYSLSANCSGSGWKANVVEISPAIVDAGSTATVHVVVTAGTGPNLLTLAAMETSAGTKVSPGEVRLPMGIDSPPPSPESRVRVALAAAGLGAAIVGNSIQFQRNKSGAIQFTVAVAEAGSYVVEPTLGNSTGWVRDSLDISSFRVAAPQAGTTANQDVNVFFTAGDSAQATDLLFAVKRPSDGLTVTYAQGFTVTG